MKLVLTVFLIPILPVAATIRPVCEESDKCGSLFFKNRYNVHRIKTDAGGTQTCENQCTLFPRMQLRSGYECGTCKNSSATTIVDAFGFDVQVLNCTADTVTVQGIAIESLQVDENFIFFNSYADYSDGICVDCSPLFRKILSIADGQLEIADDIFVDVKILKTALLTYSDVFNDEVVDLSIAADTEIEPIFNCTINSVDRSLQQFYQDKTPMMNESPNGKNRKLQSFPSQCSNWRSISSEGRCAYTDCYVGTDGDPNDCFVCKDKCDNTCGPESGIKISGNFGVYDFGEACCNHDHCYNSVFDQKRCDDEFLFDMIDACPKPPFYTRIVGPLGLTALQDSCPLTASILYSLVRNFGEEPYAVAQASQRAYEETPVCVARCPTTQSSGGQGDHRLVIDVLETSGTFPLKYDMYEIPDQLSIEYEGSVIYTTGGLVSGGNEVSVSYSGSSTYIEVNLNAPLDGTEWELFVGCPREP